MASNYPSGLDAFSTSHQDSVGEIIHAADVNNLADAVNKIEAELGTLPKGQFSSVSAKLGALFYGQVTTTQRDAITQGNRPTGLIVFNTTTNRYEFNAGSQTTPNWQPVGPAGPWGTADLSDGAVTSAKIADGTIVDADVSVGAAIGVSKLAASSSSGRLLQTVGSTPSWGMAITSSTFSGGPPSSPSNGDIWVAVGFLSSNGRMSFQYNSSSSSTYKWESMGIGGAAITGGVFTPSVDGLWHPDPSNSITAQRGGDYLVEFTGYITKSTSNNNAVSIGAMINGNDPTQYDLVGLTGINWTGNESFGFKQLFLGLSASDIIRAGLNDNNSACQLLYQMSVYPIRVI